MTILPLLNELIGSFQFHLKWRGFVSIMPLVSSNVFIFTFCILMQRYYCHFGSRVSHMINFSLINLIKNPNRGVKFKY